MAGKTKIDLTNKKIGNITVLNFSKQIGEHKYWKCKCEFCGKFFDVRQDTLNSAKIKSCGCTKQIQKNPYEIVDDYVKIFSNDYNKVALIDKEDFKRVSQFHWNLYKSSGYWATTSRPRIYLQRFILNPPRDKDVDHINHDINDNRKNNLRIVYEYQNLMNTKTYKNNTSGIKGVWFQKNINKWEAEIIEHHKYHYLGVFDKKEDAIKARKDAEEKYQKEYSYDNSIKQSEKNDI